MNYKEAADYVANGLKDHYFRFIRPIEVGYHFDKFLSPIMTEADFMANPMVLLMGQYSVGKTTFIRFLLERDFPGMRIGPEPTTDVFSAVMYGHSERVLPGNAAAVHRDKPFKGLESFGMSFLNRFEVSEVPAPILEHITLIDSPGILSGEKQRVARGYDFSQVIGYWANRADRILLLFDAHKLDISDEFKDAIQALRGNYDKIRCVMNKSDQVSQQQLMRVYGALLWSLGKVLGTPEVTRVYISSFWDRPYHNTECENLFNLEKDDLLNDLKALPRNAAVRKVNEFVKRTRRAKVHALICETLRSKFGFFGKEKKQKELLSQMNGIFKHVSTKHNMPLGDFPNPQKFAQIMSNFEMWKLPQLRPEQIQAIDDVLQNAVPRLLEQVDFRGDRTTGEDVAWNPFEVPDEVSVGGAGTPWVIGGSLKAVYDERFYSLQLAAGKASGGQIKPLMMQYGLSNAVLGQVWALSDLDQDGQMNSDEFALCMYLLDYVKNGNSLPATLPEEFVPPSFRAPAPAAQENPFVTMGMQSPTGASAMSAPASGGGAGLPPPRRASGTGAQFGSSAY